MQIFDVAIQQMQPLYMIKSSTFLAWMHIYLCVLSLYIVAEIWVWIFESH